MGKVHERSTKRKGIYSIAIKEFDNRVKGNPASSPSNSNIKKKSNKVNSSTDNALDSDSDLDQFMKSIGSSSPIRQHQKSVAKEKGPVLAELKEDHKRTIEGNLGTNNKYDLSTSSCDESDLPQMSSSPCKVDLIQNLSDESIEETNVQTIKRLYFDDKDDTLIQIKKSKSYNFEVMGEKESIIHKKALRDRFMKKYKLPLAYLEEDLLCATKQLLYTVDEVLSSKIASPYYTEAKRIANKSNKAFLSSEEFRQLDIKQFVAGYFGLKRQLTVGKQIIKLFEEKLTRNRSPAVKWWGVEDFANYVLAPEVLATLCIHDMKLLDDRKTDSEVREKAYILFQETAQYGLEVADYDPTELWELRNQEQKIKQLGLQPRKYSSSPWTWKS